MRLTATASQTVGPYFRIGLEHFYVNDIAPSAAAKDKIAIHGRVIDGDGKPVNDAVLEIWQADAHGKYSHPDDTQDRPPTPGFKGFGRVATDGNGVYGFTTVKPGSVAGPHGVAQAPHLLVAIFMRGLLIHLLTRIYFPDDPANAADPVLKLVPAERRATLIAAKVNDGLEWNVILQGQGETVFFDY
jgi:protocatechuate 3,4-dioxygenase, alpha subunit